jgi:hypothetical protein
MFHYTAPQVTAVNGQPQDLEKTARQGFSLTRGAQNCPRL